MLIPLRDATAGIAGGKAAGLGALIRNGFAVPDGFVIPFDVFRSVLSSVRAPSEAAEAGFVLRDADLLPPVVRELIARELERLGGGVVAVRSSASNEDTSSGSAAGQHETVLAAQGRDEVEAAVLQCWRSLYSERAIAYRSSGDIGGVRGATRIDAAAPARGAEMAVIVQRMVDADVAGVMFTSDVSGVTVIESSWGLGPGVVGGTVTPDSYAVTADGVISRTVAMKRSRLDRDGSRLVVSEVPDEQQGTPTLDGPTLLELTRAGTRIAATLGGRQDIEFVVAHGRLWFLQARSVTVAPPTVGALAAQTPSGAATGRTGVSAVKLSGAPGSVGRATGPARRVRGPDDFPAVRPGDVLICRFTDPAWTPLLTIVSAVVTEIGGVLSHAAIVARERGIPAVLGVADAMGSVPDGRTVTVDGTAGSVTVHP